VLILFGDMISFTLTSFKQVGYVHSHIPLSD